MNHICERATSSARIARNLLVRLSCPVEGKRAVQREAPYEAWKRRFDQMLERHRGKKGGRTPSHYPSKSEAVLAAFTTKALIEELIRRNGTRCVGVVEHCRRGVEAVGPAIILVIKGDSIDRGF